MLVPSTSDFSFQLADLGETPSTLGRKVPQILSELNELEGISIRPPMADIKLKHEWLAGWVLGARLPEGKPVVNEWVMPESLVRAVFEAEKFQTTDWALIGGPIIEAAGLPVRDIRGVLVAAFQLSTWSAPSADYQKLSAGRFFAGQANQPLKWLKSYFRAKSMLKRADKYRSELPLCGGEEETALSKALLQVPICLSRADSMQSDVLLKAAMQLVQQAFTRLWVAKPLESNVNLAETAYRFALLGLFVRSVEAICRMGGIELEGIEGGIRG